MFRCEKCGSGYGIEQERIWTNGKKYMQRKYECKDCGHVFWTYEVPETVCREFLDVDNFKYIKPTPEEILEKVMKRNIEEYKRKRKR